MEEQKRLNKEQTKAILNLAAKGIDGLRSKICLISDEGVESITNGREALEGNFLWAMQLRCRYNPERNLRIKVYHLTEEMLNMPEKECNALLTQYLNIEIANELEARYKKLKENLLN
jgi:hypothetical protein